MDCICCLIWIPVYQYLNLISLCLVFVAVEIKKRKKVLSWLFLLRRLSPSSDFSGASETELKTSLFAQPLSALCSDEDTLPRPIQVGARSLLTLLQKNLWNLSVIVRLNLCGPVFHFSHFGKWCFRL